MKRAIIFLTFLLFVPLSAGPTGNATPAAQRLVAVGDIHGEAEGFAGILRQAQLIDERGQWAGGNAVLVQTGDFLDRGPKVRAVMDLLMSLEAQAPAAGGRVYVLLGNHEGLNLLGETRDATDAIYASFADEKSQQRREQAYAAYTKLMAARAMALGPGKPAKGKEEWLAAHPPGYLEYREALGPDGRYGKWLRSKDAILQVGQVLFLHGGLNPDTAPAKIDDINKEVRREIKWWDDARELLESERRILPFFTMQEMLEAVGLELQHAAAAQAADERHETDSRVIEILQPLTKLNSWFFINPEGPLWYRGFATMSPQDGPAVLSKLLARYKAAQIVVGHTVPATMRITPRFNRQVFLIDTGMLSSVYQGGRASALEIVDGRFTAIYQDSRTPLSSESVETVAR